MDDTLDLGPESRLCGYTNVEKLIIVSHRGGWGMKTFLLDVPKFSVFK